MTRPGGAPILDGIIEQLHLPSLERLEQYYDYQAKEEHYLWNNILIQAASALLCDTCDLVYAFAQGNLLSYPSTCLAARGSPTADACTYL